MKINFNSLSGGIILALAISGCSSDINAGADAAIAKYHAASAKHFTACLDAGGVPKMIDASYHGCVEAPNHKGEE